MAGAVREVHALCAAGAQVARASALALFAAGRRRAAAVAHAAVLQADCCVDADPLALEQPLRAAAATSHAGAPCSALRVAPAAVQVAGAHVDAAATTEAEPHAASAAATFAEGAAGAAQAAAPAVDLVAAEVDAGLVAVRQAGAALAHTGAEVAHPVARAGDVAAAAVARIAREVGAVVPARRSTLETAAAPDEAPAPGSATQVAASAVVVAGAELYAGALAVDERLGAARLAFSERADLLAFAGALAGAAVLGVLGEGHALGAAAELARPAARGRNDLSLDRVDEHGVAARREHERGGSEERERHGMPSLAHGETSTPSANTIASGPTLADSRPTVRKPWRGASHQRSASARAATQGATRYLAERPT